VRHSSGTMRWRQRELAVTTSIAIRVEREGSDAFTAVRPIEDYGRAKVAERTLDVGMHVSFIVKK
jgi:hypothetical protein